MPQMTDARREDVALPIAEASVPAPARGRSYWRSLGELADTPEFREYLHREFPSGASELLETDRRAFLKVMGASLALAGATLSGCRRWPQEKIAPFAHRPPGRVPGSTQFYATALERQGVGQALLVTAYDGRPIKVDGNPEHPISRGASDALAQASVLDLYDPDRCRSVLHKAGPDRRRATWGEFESWASGHFAGLAAARGEGLAILSEATSSPTLARLRKRFTERFPRAAWYEWEPLNNDNELAGSISAFDRPYRTQLSLDKARVIVSLDSDFLIDHPAAVKLTRDFAAGRRAEGPDPAMNRLYVFESAFSLTGANADHRETLRSADVAVVAGLLAKRLVPDMRPASMSAGRRFDEAKPADIDLDPAVLDRVVADLESNRGKSVLVAGPRQPAEVHALVHLLNEQLGNLGNTVGYTEPPQTQSHLASISALVRGMDAGTVGTLLILGPNPVYDAPADLEFGRRLAGVANTVRLGIHDDETGHACTWQLPQAHFLESWSDTRCWDGTYSVGQPIIEPLFGGRSAAELLALLMGETDTAGYGLVKRTFASDVRDGANEKVWRRALHDGFVPQSVEFRSPKVKRSNFPLLADDLWQRWSPAAEGTFEAVFARDFSVLDGRFANNGWMQELPDPITKLTWDNAVLIAPSAAHTLGVKTGDMVDVVMPDARTVKAAALVLPGQHAGSVTLSLGYGRELPGPVAAGAGFDFYKLRTSQSMGYASGARVTRASGSYVLAITQDHHAVGTVGERGTQERLPTLFREATLEEFRSNPRFAEHRLHVPHSLSLWTTDLMADAQYRWGMTIDLSACTGCNACVVACQAENNIPVVGKDQVNRGREMHWLRVDRYFKGSDPDRPEATLLQPVPCMMCENAPCEQVCPVAATTHDRDGLNVMVYNRCVGTRYCSNNCPYKVRRFNFFDYQVRDPVREQRGILAVKPAYWERPQSDTHPLHQLQFNPEVTVRSRGVMEKCTYCVQRITDAKIQAKNAWVKMSDAEKQADRRVAIRDGTFTTACAQACPAQAIVFGDLADPRSEVSARQDNPRLYEMLEELNTRPRTKYLARLRNPAPGLGPASSPATTDHGTHHG